MATLLSNGRYQSRKRLPDGTRIAGYGSTPQEADADLAERIRELESIPSTSLTAGATLHDIAKAVWYPRIEQLRPLSTKKYKGIYINWIRPAISRFTPAEITPSHIQGIIREAAKEGRSPRLAKFIRALCFQILECAIELGMIHSNPARYAKVPKAPQRRERRVDVEAAGKLFEHLAGTELAAPVFLALVLGLRRGEIAGLKWEDLNRQTGELWIVRQRQAIRPHGVVETPLKTSGSRRVLRLFPKLVEAIDARGDLDSEYICTRAGMPWVPDTITERWNALRPEEFEGWTFHDLRHGAAGMLYAATRSVLSVQRVLGHAKPDMTLQYTAIDEAMAGDAIRDAWEVAL